MTIFLTCHNGDLRHLPERDFKSDTDKVHPRSSQASVPGAPSGVRRGSAISRGVVILLLSTLMTTACWRGKVLSAETGQIPQPTPDATVGSVVRNGARSPVPVVSPSPTTGIDSRSAAPAARPSSTVRPAAPRTQPTPTPIKSPVPTIRAAAPTTSAAPQAKPTVRPVTPQPTQRTR